LKVELIAHTQLSDKFKNKIKESIQDYQTTDGQIVSMLHIRNCYSPLHPTDIIQSESDKYFGKKAKDGEHGNDAERLIRQIVHSGHTSTLEGINFDFSIEGVSRALLAQITRHRVGFSFSVKGMRYVKLGSKDKSGGAHFYTPDKINTNQEALNTYNKFLELAQVTYDALRGYGIPQEDARNVLPQSTLCDIMMSCNLRALLDFYSKRQHGKGAQAEIADLAEELRKSVIEVEPWIDQFFEETKK
jgi:thymidylate synthase (FAD)